MRTRGPRIVRGRRAIVIGISSIALAVSPLVGAPAVGANPRTSHSEHLSLSARATRHCGAVTFTFSPDNPVTYIQVNAIDVSCAVAKHVLIEEGKHNPATVKGWAYLNSGAMGTSNCFITFKHGSDRVVAYRQNVDGEGC